MMSLFRRGALFAVLTVLAGFGGLVLHEVVGHALLASLFGASNVSIRLNPDFTGSVSYALDTLTTWETRIVDAGGIGVNLFTGLASLPLGAAVARQWPERRALRLLLVLFGGISVYKALEYPTMSFFYGGPGDPLEHADPCTIWHSTGVWLLPLVAIPFAAFVFGRAYQRVHAGTLAAGMGIAAPTLVLGGLFYYRGSLPLIGDSDRWHLARAVSKARFCQLAVEDVRAPFPMLPVVLVLAAFGGLAGAWFESRSLHPARLG